MESPHSSTTRPRRSHFNMTDQELRAWQRETITECHYENEINSYLESTNVRRMIEDSTGMEQISLGFIVAQFGVQRRPSDEDAEGPPSRRLRTCTLEIHPPSTRVPPVPAQVANNGEPSNGNIDPTIATDAITLTIQTDAINEAIRQRGLHVSHGSDNDDSSDENIACPPLRTEADGEQPAHEVEM